MCSCVGYIYIVAGGATCNEEVTRFLYISPDVEFFGLQR